MVDISKKKYNIYIFSNIKNYKIFSTYIVYMKLRYCARLDVATAESGACEQSFNAIACTLYTCM